MVMVGLTALPAGGAGWLATGHRDSNGAFTADPHGVAFVTRGAERPVSVFATEVDELESMSSSIEELEDEMSDVVERDEQSNEGNRGRWGNLLRRRSGGRHEASSTVEHDASTVEQEYRSARDRFQGESPYIYTAT
jgi:hypothetical protein